MVRPSVTAPGDRSLSDATLNKKMLTAVERMPWRPDHRGSTGPAEHFIRTTYLPIWPPRTYAAVKCHINVV